VENGDRRHNRRGMEGHKKRDERRRKEKVEEIAVKKYNR
jgi:hypothetical protein